MSAIYLAWWKWNVSLSGKFHVMAADRNFVPLVMEGKTFRLADDFLKLLVGVSEYDTLPKFAQSLPHKLEVGHQ